MYQQHHRHQQRPCGRTLQIPNYRIGRYGYVCKPSDGSNQRPLGEHQKRYTSCCDDKPKKYDDSDELCASSEGDSDHYHPYPKRHHHHNYHHKYHENRCNDCEKPCTDTSGKVSKMYECSSDELPDDPSELRIAVWRTDSHPPCWCTVPLPEFLSKYVNTADD